jgi:hypothetical protein
VERTSFFRARSVVPIATAIGDQVGAVTSRSNAHILLLSITNQTQQSRSPIRTKSSEAEFMQSIVHGTDGRAQKAAAKLPHMTPVRSANRAAHLAVSLRDRADMNICGNVAADVVVSHFNSKCVKSLCSRLGAAIRCGLLVRPIAPGGKVASSVSINPSKIRAAATI